ncbi:MAG: hypothetical protein ACTHJ4_05085, partial [Candidatus Nucleicultricaceae bacterium]
ILSTQIKEQQRHELIVKYPEALSALRRGFYDFIVGVNTLTRKIDTRKTPIYQQDDQINELRISLENNLESLDFLLLYNGIEIGNYIDNSIQILNEIWSDILKYNSSGKVSSSVTTGLTVKIYSPLNKLGTQINNIVKISKQKIKCIVR